MAELSPSKKYSFSTKVNWLPSNIENLEKDQRSWLRRRTSISIPLLLAICVLLVCSAVLFLSNSFASGSLLCNLTKFCATAHNSVNQVAVNSDPRPPLNAPFSFKVGQSNGSSVDVTLTPALYPQPRCNPAADYSNSLMFVSGWNSNTEIFITNPGGTSICRVTDNLIFEAAVDWTADRKRILFVSPRDNEDSNDVYTMAFDGSQIVNASHDRFSEQRATWSPDGTKIAFNYFINQQGRFSVMDADGSNRQDVTPDSWNVYNASWSPDSTKIAFNRVVKGAIHEIDAIDLTTYAQTLLTVGTFGDEFAWSPDGASLLVLVSDGNDTNITRIGIATGESERLAKIASVSNPIWSPDGTQVAFLSLGAIQILDLTTKAVHTLPISGFQDIRLVSWR